MKTFTINISTKANEAQLTRWLIVQNIPYPDFESCCGGLRWRNGGSLFPCYGQKFDGIGESFSCFLLAANVADVPARYDRTSFAGYEGRPGTIKFRGKDLGEMSVEFSGNSSYADIRLAVCYRPTGSVRELIEKQIVPLLREFIEQNKSELKAEAVARLRQHMRQKLAEVRSALAKLEGEAEEALTRA